VLQVGLGQADVAGAAQPAPAPALRDRAFDARTSGVRLGDGVGRLPRAGGDEREVLLSNGGSNWLSRTLILLATSRRVTRLPPAA